MSVTERRRHELHEWAKRVGDEEVAATLMELLPPVGWADVATKRDLDHLGAELRAEMSAVRSELRVEIAGVKAELHDQLRLQTYWLIGSMWAVLGVGLTVASRI